MAVEVDRVQENPGKGVYFMLAFQHPYPGDRATVRLSTDTKAGAVETAFGVAKQRMFLEFALPAPVAGSVSSQRTAAGCRSARPATKALFS
jgi:hypothetical protein